MSPYLFDSVMMYCKLAEQWCSCLTTKPCYWISTGKVSMFFLCTGGFSQATLISCQSSNSCMLGYLHGDSRALFTQKSYLFILYIYTYFLLNIFFANTATHLKIFPSTWKHNKRHKRLVDDTMMIEKKWFTCMSSFVVCKSHGFSFFLSAEM